jgi:hypothetical protein
LEAKRIKLVGHVPAPDTFADFTRAKPDQKRYRIFLLSPANISGERAKLVLREGAKFSLAQRLRQEGAPLGEVFSFISGLYFRGKLAYARAYANPPAGVPGVVVITAARGLMSPERVVSLQELIDLASAPVDEKDSRYREPLEADARILCDAMGADCEAVLLGSIATPKYVEPLSGVFGERLSFPADFIGLGDMSRGAVLLRCVREGVQLNYATALGLSKNAAAKSAIKARPEEPKRNTKKKPAVVKPSTRRRQR